MNFYWTGPIFSQIDTYICKFTGFLKIVPTVSGNLEWSIVVYDKNLINEFKLN